MNFVAVTEITKESNQRTVFINTSEISTITEKGYPGLFILMTNGYGLHVINTENLVNALCRNFTDYTQKEEQ